MTWMHTASGRAFDLLSPRAEDVDFKQDIAPALSRLARFGGHVPGGAYSVAQHCVVGADALLAETGNFDAALAFLLHDAHEAYIGDIGTPVALALASCVGACAAVSPDLRQVLPPDRANAAGRGVARSALALLRHSLDVAIHKAACLPWPLPPGVAQHVALMDRRMLHTERQHLLQPCPRPWPGDDTPPPPIRMRGRIRVWAAALAAEEWLARLDIWAPKHRRA